ncbi:hypothetical protein E4656_04340 [Natronospirillum operosum]|uniref:Uncharacterized protein n=1 Tax=Natronospirillum operosum TaxID=2759953 RepID=A0A4Z0WIG9_9GAMM|nr:hypothetical protein [Natronospirillum operosum]TGG95647.1 hypothetical protein E4656_04340 [Natronospirillum operosum]
MRDVRRLLFRYDALQALPADADGAQTALEDASRLLLWRAWIALLQSLCADYRLRPEAATDSMSEAPWLHSLRTFNPDMAELQQIELASRDPDHWLPALRNWWSGYWQPGLIPPARLAPAATIARSAADWSQDARAGLAAWADLWAQHSQTN